MLPCSSHPVPPMNHTNGSERNCQLHHYLRISKLHLTASPSHHHVPTVIVERLSTEVPARVREAGLELFLDAIGNHAIAIQDEGERILLDEICQLDLQDETDMNQGFLWGPIKTHIVAPPDGRIVGAANLAAGALGSS